MSERWALILTLAGEAVVAVGLVCAGVGAASGQTGQSDMIRYGHTIAVRYCGECHAVDRGQKSPLADAPPMPELYRRFPVERMAEALELGMMNDHPRMPDFKLDGDERAALTAYLSSFAPPRLTTSPPPSPPGPPEPPGPPHGGRVIAFKTPA